MADSILTRARPLLAARLAGAALSIAVPMVLARVLLPASYGTFKQAWLVSQTLVMMLPMGLTQSLYYFVPREPALRDRFVAQALWTHLALGALGGALLLAGRPLLAAHFGNSHLGATMGWTAALTALTIAGAPLDVAWNASGRIGAAALARLATEGLRSLALVAGAVLYGSVEGALAGMTLATLARAAFGFVALARRHGLAVRADALRRQVAYALPFGLAFLLIVPQQQFHQYAVGAAVTAAAFAIYSIGTFQLPVVDVLYTPVSELLQIGLAESDGAGRPPRAGLALFHEAVLQLSFAFLPLTGLLFVVAPALIELVFSPVYLPAAPIFRATVVSVLLAALPLDGVMRARAQNRFMLALSAAKLAVTVPLVLGGLRWVGPIGALLGWIAAEVLARGAMLRRAATLFDAPPSRILPLRALARQAGATLFAMPQAWLVLQAVSGPLLLRLTASGVAFAVAYLGLSWARGWLPAGWVGLFRARRADAAPASTEP
ncbi:MAG TPA: oligosaccharide flippase family protein [Anaeromyxobacter sp.]|nr:oligosaccharide flippase family protein [Anaeromyxobacter sp.]